MSLVKGSTVYRIESEFFIYRKCLGNGFVGVSTIFFTLNIFSNKNIGFLTEIIFNFSRKYVKRILKTRVCSQLCYLKYLDSHFPSKTW